MFPVSCLDSKQICCRRSCEERESLQAWVHFSPQSKKTMCIFKKSQSKIWSKSKTKCRKIKIVCIIRKSLLQKNPWRLYKRAEGERREEEELFEMQRLRAAVGAETTFWKGWNVSFTLTEVITLISFSCGIFLSWTHHSAHRASREGGGKHWPVFSPPRTQTHSLGLNGTLCAGLCLNESEGIWRQDQVLSSNTGSLRGISPKGEFIGVCRVEQETLPWVLRRSGCLHEACLANKCVFISAAAARKSPPATRWCCVNT